MDKTSLYYFDARYNSPEFRHFTQADIAEPDYSDPQDLNRYSYVGNNPLSYVDYDGYKKKKKKHLSKREQRARALGLNPDKDKYKVGKMSDREYKKALAAHKAASKPKYATVGGLGYQLTGVGTVQLNIYYSTGRSVRNSQLLSHADIEATLAAAKLSPLGDAIDGGMFSFKTGKFFIDEMIGNATGGRHGKIHSISETYNELENVPFGPGFVFKAGKFFVDEMVGNATGGKRGKIHSVSETYDVLESVPFGVGEVFTAGKYLSKDVIGELLYENGWY